MSELPPFTVKDLLMLALRDSGVIGTGQTAMAQDINDAAQRLANMLAGWNRKRWLIWHLVDTVIPSTGKQSYTIGPGGDVNVVVRPDRAESAFFRQIINSSPPNQIDYGLEILQSREDYNRIALKQLQSFGMYLFYDPGWPVGNIYVWPVPQANIYEIHVSFKDNINYFVPLNEPLSVPPEHTEAILYNLMIRLRVAYRLLPDPGIMALAKDTLNTLRKANAQIPRLQMPAGLSRPSGYYNVYSDQVR